MYNKEYEQLKVVAVLLFNSKMEQEGINLRYVDDGSDGDIKSYKLILDNRFIDKVWDNPVNLSLEGELEIREFFACKGVKFLFSNTVRVIS